MTTWMRLSGRWPIRVGGFLLDSLNEGNGQTLRELCSGLDMARQSVSKHLAILEAANLVIAVRREREKLHYLNAAPINEIGERRIAPTAVPGVTEPM
jgi:DNA-binding transcriptional ArsR family regulator